MSLASLLAKDTATLQRPTQAADTSGGLVPTFANLATGVNVRVEDAKSSTVRNYATDGIIVTHTIFTQNGSGAKSDRWITSDGRYMQVQGIRKRRGIGGMDTFYNYDCLELRPGA